MQKQSFSIFCRRFAVTGIAALLLGGSAAEAQNRAAPSAVAKWAGRSEWRASGMLFEACSCIVPCPCNFGQGPLAAATGKRDYCHTVYAYRLTTASYDGVKLDGLIFGGGEAESGAFGFLDARATAAQKPALEKLARAVFGKGGASGGSRRYLTTPIKAEETPGKFRVNFGSSGGFAADILLGADGKNPVIVENNVTWPVKRFIKGKTTAFDYHDPLGNRLRLDGVNANLGAFDLSGGAGQSGANAGGGCCASGK